MPGIQCRCCEKRKLSKEFIEINAFPTCDHPPLLCLRCMVKGLEENGKCPFTGCQIEGKDEWVQEVIRKSQERLNYMFSPDVESIQRKVVRESEVIWIVTFAGEKKEMPYNKDMKIKELRKEVKKLLAKSEVEKEENVKLIFQGKELCDLIEGKENTLSEAGVQQGHFISVQLVLYSVDQKLREVVFEIKWKYSGKPEATLKALEREVDSEKQRLKELVCANQEVLDHTAKVYFPKKEKITINDQYFSAEKAKQYLKIPEIRKDIETYNSQIQQLDVKRMEIRSKDMVTEYLDGTCFVMKGKQIDARIDMKSTIYTNNKGAISIQHSGDDNDQSDKNVTQRITVKFLNFTNDITHLVFVASADATESEKLTLASFGDIDISICSVGDGKKLCETNISEPKFQAVILCILKKIGDKWQVFPSGMPCMGCIKNYKPITERVMEIIETDFM